MRKRVFLITVLLCLTLAGCGKTGAPSASVSSNPPSNAQTNKLPQVNPQAQQFDTKSSQGQKQVDQEMDAKLQNLDKALNALDSSLGKIE